MKNKIAIMYDFDGTLSPINMQEYSFIPQIKMKPGEFWDLCNELAKTYNMDSNLAYMYLMTSKAKENGISITKKDFINHGKEIKYFEGVLTWFKRINEYAKNLGLEVEHYIISCGVQEIVEGCSIAYLLVLSVMKRMFLFGHLKL